MAKPHKPNPGPGAAARRRIGLQTTVNKILQAKWDGELAAQSLYARVAEYHGHVGGYATRYEDLTDEERARWLRAGVAALEGATDHIITAGRPVWWTAE